MSENEEVGNKFADDPADQQDAMVNTPSEETAPHPTAVADAVNEALQKQAPGKVAIQLNDCPCGSAGDLMLDVPQGTKVGRASCSNCGVWGVDFLVPRTNNQEILAKAAGKAWNEAPRG